MTVTTSQYIHNIDRASGPHLANEEFLIPFSYSGESELVVWTVADGVYVRRYSGVDYQVFDSKIRWVGASPTDDIRIQRAMKYDQQSRLGSSTASGIERSADDLCKRGHQQLKPNILDPKNFSAEGDRISNVASPPSAAAHAVNKSDVDDTFGVDTPTHSNWTLAPGDVGKYISVDSSGDTEWVDFNGVPDPLGKEGDYLTGAGWDTFGVIPSVGASKQILKDVDGLPTWTSVNEVPTGGVYGQILTRNATPAPAWRNSGYTPTPLTHKRYSTARHNSYDSRNEWNGKFFMTSHNITMSHDEGCTGGGEWMGPNIIQHRVWLGSITHAHGIPDFVMAKHTGVWLHRHNIAWFQSSPSRSNIPFSQYFPVVIHLNLVSVSATTIEVAASTMIHRFVQTTNAALSDPNAAGNWMWSKGVGSVGIDESYSPVPEDLTVPMTLMWYFNE